MRMMTRTMMLAAFLAGLAGCQVVPQTTTAQAAPPAPAQPEQAKYLSQMAIRDETAPSTPSGVDVALMWSDKYAKASEQVVDLTGKNQELTNQNRQLGGQVARLEIELENTRKELSEANTMLMEVRAELEKWKSNVLGFREEMRQAQQVQLEALAKILKLLDGEISPAMQEATAATAATATATQTEKPDAAKP